MINIGDKVEFRGKGRTQTGVVTKIRYKSRKGRVRELIEQFGGSALTQVAEILDQNGTSYWTVNTDHLKVIGRGQPNVAIQKVNEIKTNIWHRKDEIKSNHIDEASKKDLFGLKDGDPIMVTYKGNVKLERIFRGFVSSSGNIRYEQYGHIRTTSPKFVEKK